MSIEQHIRAIKAPTTDTSTFRHLYYNFKYWLADNNPFTRYIIVNSAQEYINMPRKDRTYLYLWYLDTIIYDDKNVLGKKSDYEAIDTFNKYKFPIQYFLRENGSKLMYKLERAYDWLRYEINPRQKWLTKQIPNHWSDKTHLIPELNFAMIVHFVEGEKCFDNTDYEASGEAHAKFARELMECYLYIKTRRPNLQKQHENSYPNEDTRTGDYSVDYAETNRLEKLLDDEDTKWLTWIVKNRNFLWT
jgi:hypothetical protein